jgi:hypothetical protein
MSDLTEREKQIVAWLRDRAALFMLDSEYLTRCNAADAIEHHEHRNGEL